MGEKVEEWRQVMSGGAHWLVSSLGNVRVPARETTYTRTRLGKTLAISSHWPERALTPCKSRDGYMEVGTLVDGRRVKQRVHRLVALAFAPGHAEHLTVNHIDGVKSNNLPANLEWVSLARNTEHQWQIGLAYIRGDLHPGAVLSSKRVVYIRRLLAKGITPNTLAVVAGVDPTVIYRIRDGKSWASVVDDNSTDAP